MVENFYNHIKTLRIIRQKDKNQALIKKCITKMIDI